MLLGALQAFAPLSIDMYLPAMPVMETVFHTSAAAVQITMVTFLLGYAVGQSLYGPITDRFGRKPPLYASLLLFIAASAACALAPSIPLISAFRLLQAIGACGGAVMSRAMVRDLFPPQDLRRIFSMLVLVLGVSPVVAPMFGSSQERPVLKKPCIGRSDRVPVERASRIAAERFGKTEVHASHAGHSERGLRDKGGLPAKP